MWSRRLKEFICARDDFVFYVIWYLEPVKWFQNLVGIRRPGCCNDGKSKAVCYYVTWCLYHRQYEQWLALSINGSAYIADECTCFLHVCCSVLIEYWVYQGLPRHAVEHDGRLMFANVSRSDAGEYTCTAVDLPHVGPASVTLSVEFTCKSQRYNSSTMRMCWWWFFIVIVIVITEPSYYKIVFLCFGNFWWLFQFGVDSRIHVALTTMQKN